MSDLWKVEVGAGVFESILCLHGWIERSWQLDERSYTVRWFSWGRFRLVNQFGLLFLLVYLYMSIEWRRHFRIFTAWHDFCIYYQIFGGHRKCPFLHGLPTHHFSTFSPPHLSLSLSCLNFSTPVTLDNVHNLLHLPSNLTRKRPHHPLIHQLSITPHPKIYAVILNTLRHI